MTSAELLLHPVRLRIVQAFLGQHERTTAGLRRTLPDVATATLYRQVATLVEGGVLEVTGERRVRGAVERTYRLRGEHASVSPDDVAAMSVEDHRRAFTTFVAGLLADFDRYTAHGDVDLQRDLVGYRQAGFHATDAELLEIVAAIGAVLAPWLGAEPRPGRRRRILTTVLLPAADPDEP